jgi:PAS domain S-box-containing protein
MHAAGFTPQEIAQLDSAKRTSDALTATEDDAFQAMKGEYRDAAGRFTRRGRPDRALAMRLVNDSAYNHRKALIMRPIDAFLGMVEDRSEGELDTFHRQTVIAVLTADVALGVFLLLLLASYPLLRQRILQPVITLQAQTQSLAADLDQLATVAKTIADGDSPPSFAAGATPIRSRRRDEIGELSRLHDGMLERLESTGASVASITGQLRDANEALASHLRRAHDLASMATFTIDLEHRAIRMSAEMAALFGVGNQPMALPLDEYRNRFYHQDDRAPSVDKAESAYASGQATAMESRVVRGDGRTIWVRAASAVERDASGASVVEGVIQDITPEREAEQQLRASQEELQRLANRFSSIFQESPVALTVTDAETGRIETANGAFARLIGAESMEEIVGRTTLELGLWEGDSEQRRRAVARVESKNRNTATVIPLRLRSGELRTVEAMSSRYELEGKQFVLASIVDITDRLRAERERRRAEEQYRELFEGVRDVVFSLSPEGMIAMLSPAFETITGMSAADWIGRPFTELLHPEDAPRATEQLRASLTGRPVEAPPLHIRTKAGWSLADIRTAPRIEDGRMTGVFGIARDVSERVGLEEQLRQSQKMQALGTLAGGIAHDFNNILTAINGNAELALEEGTADDPVRISIQEIRKAGQRAKDLVKQILIFSRRQETRRQVIALGPVVDEALRLLRTTLPKTISITTHEAPGLPKVLADATQIHQIIMNLGTNAGHAMGERGTLAVELERVVIGEDGGPSGELRPGTHIGLTVRDSGTGMSPEVLRRVFEPFFTTKGTAGTGLGLSVVHGIMRDHEGAITVESELGRGTTFHLLFPAATAAGTAPAAGTVERVRGRGEHIMLVDDEESLVFVTSRILTRLGYRCTIFTSPHDALQAFRTSPRGFDAVVTDLSMPGMSGLDLIHAIKALRGDVPIAIASGTPAESDRAKTADADAMIHKPATIDELAEAVSALFGRQPGPAVDS